MKSLMIIFLSILFFSCNRKVEFVQSKVTSNLFLIKNPTEYQKEPFHINFYKYTYNTKYFINNLPDPGGFSSEELINYPEDNISNFIVTKCDNDTTKLVGELRFYNQWGNHFKPDTIIYKCD